MRIAVVEPVGRGGMIHYAWQLARGLAAGGDEVVLVTDRKHELRGLAAPFRIEAALRLWDAKPAAEGQPGPLARRLRRVGRALVWYREWLRLLLVLRRLRPDAVLLGDIRFPGDLVPLLLLRRLAARLGDVCHNVRPYLGGAFADHPWLRGLYRRIYRQFDTVFVHFEVNRRELLASLDLDPARIAVIPHGNEELFRELEAGPPPMASAEPVVLCFGTLARYKGIDVLLEAFARVRRELPAVRLVVAGFPAPDFDLDQHQALAVNLGVADAVTWVARYIETPEVGGWMRAATVAAFPHREVFQSGVLAVAMTFGVPIIATRAGANPEVIEAGVSGLLVPPGDAAALAAALLELLRDPERARRMGARAAEVAASRFAWAAIGQQIRERLA